MTNKKHRYKFSFVIPIYNVEAYLAETVESILAQTMDFEQNCEIIFVNDGSPDNSEEICIRYQQQFPNNIKYIKQENGGLSAARNTGISKVEGKYVNFIDPDDKLSPDTAETVYEFFERHYDQIDATALKIQMFEAKTGGHILNYRFKTSRVIDVEKESSMIQLHAASAFIKTEALLRHQFDSRIRKFAEDLKFMTELIIDKMAYGVVAEPTYFYRKRDAGSSIMDSERSSKVWYTDIPTLVHQSILDYAKNKYGTVPKYVQHVVMHDIQWRLRQSSQYILTDKEVIEYKKLIINILKQIDDDVILAQKHMQYEVKLFALTKKYPQKPVLSWANRKGLAFYYNGLKVYDYDEADPVVHIEIVKYTNDNLILEGHFNGFLFKDLSFRFKAGEAWFDVERVKRKNISVYFFDEVVFDRNYFRVELPLKPGADIAAYVVAGDTKRKLRLYPHRTARFSHNTNHSYRIYGTHVATMGRHELSVQKRSLTMLCGKELRRLAGILSRRQYRNAATRSLAIGYRLISRKKIWLFSDRTYAAGDNAEALFRYAVEQAHNRIAPYFVLSHGSKDYDRLRRIGKVVDPDSILYRVLFLSADKVISSQADEYVINPFGGKVLNFVDLFKFDFVFLQHGITHNDLSKWLNRYNKNIKLFVASAKPEYRALLSGDYGYDESIVKLTGMPRYDYLKNHNEGKLIVMPTWRQTLAGIVDKGTGIRAYNPEFTASDYYKFYQKLIDDKHLQAVLEQNHMTAEFYLHPSLSSQIDDFKGNNLFHIMQLPYDYRNAFSKGSLMITDYSSVAFDFAYLKKPIIYAQFDKAEFYTKHPWDPGYFSYEDDGFGKVIYDYENTLREVIKTIELGCKTPRAYESRVNSFFYMFDRNNSRRVYGAVLNIEDKD